MSIKLKQIGAEEYIQISKALSVIQPNQRDQAYAAYLNGAELEVTEYVDIVAKSIKLLPYARITGKHKNGWSLRCSKCNDLKSLDVVTAGSAIISDSGIQHITSRSRFGKDMNGKSLDIRWCNQLKQLSVTTDGKVNVYASSIETVENSSIGMGNRKESLELQGCWKLKRVDIDVPGSLNISSIIIIQNKDGTQSIVSKPHKIDVIKGKFGANELNWSLVISGDTRKKISLAQLDITAASCFYCSNADIKSISSNTTVTKSNTQDYSVISSNVTVGDILCPRSAFNGLIPQTFEKVYMRKEMYKQCRRSKDAQCTTELDLL